METRPLTALHMQMTPVLGQIKRRGYYIQLYTIINGVVNNNFEWYFIFSFGTFFDGEITEEKHRILCLTVKTIWRNYFF